MKSLGNASNNLKLLYVEKRPTPAKFKNNKLLMKISFQSKGKDPHTLLIKTTKTCLIKDCNKKIATQAAFGKITIQ
jgi:hypothetical protein